MSTTDIGEDATVEEVQQPRYIVLPHGCEPSVVCSTDRTRPVLLHGYLRRRDDDLWLYATDSFIVVGLKVDGDAREGWVPRPVLEALERGDLAEQVSETAWRVGMDGMAVTYDIAGQVGDVPFPTVSTFLHDDMEPEAVQSVGLDPALTDRLALGLGARWGVVLSFSGQLRAFRVTSTGYPATQRVGAQMPVRVA